MRRYKNVMTECEDGPFIRCEDSTESPEKREIQEIIDVIVYLKGQVAELKKKMERGVMTRQEIIGRLDFGHLDSKVPCKILFRDSIGNIVGAQIVTSYVIVDGTIIVDARRQ